ncbi:hypothetical protein [Virgibacillus subterraneus]|uniref:hypothetical protein n=1 Tax=Virgibacillus subterraneus TaxID=621109 RepID=UPI001FE05200|nr:hypothetical protein [Virgibacillus subterraneus]
MPKLLLQIILTFVNFVSAIVIGNIAKSLATSQNPSIPNSIFGIGLMDFIYPFWFIDIKSKSASKVTTGNPV